MQGVRKVSVDLESKLARVELQMAQGDVLSAVPLLVQAVRDLGFEAEPHTA